MSQVDETVVIGKVGAPYGVKGWVKINSYTQVPENIFAYRPWCIGTLANVLLDQWRAQGNGLIAKLVGVDSREDADRLKNLDISIAASLLPELEEGEYYWRELTGLQVVTTQGYDLGTVKDIFNTGANDVLSIRARANDAFGQKERLLPFIVDSVIQKVDKQAGVITVDWDPAF